MREQLRASLTAGYPAADPPRKPTAVVDHGGLGHVGNRTGHFQVSRIVSFPCLRVLTPGAPVLEGWRILLLSQRAAALRHDDGAAGGCRLGRSGRRGGDFTARIWREFRPVLLADLAHRALRARRVAASLVFMFLSLHLEFAAALNQESLYIASCLAALLALDRWLGAIVSGQRATWRETVLLALFVAAPFWVRYAGVSIFGIGWVLCAGIAMLWPERRRQALAVAALTCVILGVLFFRNQAYGGTISGHPLGITPAENLFTASVKILYLTGLSWVQPVGLAVYGWWKVAMACGIALLLLLLAWSLRRQPRALLALAFGLSQFAVIAIASSVTRIDELNPRFVLPAFVFLAIALGVFWSRQSSGSSCDSLDWQPLILGLLLFLCLQMAAKVISSFHWSDLRPVPDYPRLAGTRIAAGTDWHLAGSAPAIAGLFRRRSSTDGPHAQSSERWRWLRPADFFNEGPASTPRAGGHGRAGLLRDHSLGCVRNARAARGFQSLVAGDDRLDSRAPARRFRGAGQPAWDATGGRDAGLSDSSGAVHQSGER